MKKTSDPILEGVVARLIKEATGSDRDSYLEYLNQPGASLEGLRAAFPDKEVIINDLAKEYKLRLGSAIADKEGFVPLAGMDHPVLEYLGQIAQDKGLVPYSQDPRFAYELRISLYNNFNRYLNRLLGKLPDESAAAAAADDLVTTPDSETFINKAAKLAGLRPFALCADFLKI